MKGLIYKCDYDKNYRENDFYSCDIKDIIDYVEDEHQEILPINEEIDTRQIIEDVEKRTNNSLLEICFFDTVANFYEHYMWDVRTGKMKKQRHDNNYTKDEIFNKLNWKYGIKIQKALLDPSPYIKILNELDIPYLNVERNENNCTFCLSGRVLDWSQFPDDFDYYEPTLRSYCQLNDKLKSKIYGDFEIKTYEKRGISLIIYGEN